jgi:hypothetical protein
MEKNIMNKKIVFMGDFHLGNVACDEELIKKKIRRIARMNNTFVFLMGDLIENAVNNVGVDEQLLSVDYQLRKLKEIIAPIKDKILGCVLGNHETRTNKKSQSHIIKELYEAILGVPCYEFAHKFEFEGYKIIVNHPEGRGTTLGWVTRQFVNISQVYGGDYDLMVLAHFHRLLHYKRYYVDMSDDLKVKHEIICGHFIDYKNGYAHKKMLSPQKKGCYIVTFHNDKYIDLIEVKEF